MAKKSTETTSETPANSWKIKSEFEGQTICVKGLSSPLSNDMLSEEFVEKHMNNIQGLIEKV